MPRKARVKGATGIYHIILRGINRQNIFIDDEDREKLLATLIRYKEKSGYRIYAYCFMSNHFHLLLKEGGEPLEQIMRRICGSYVYWYNTKYERIGNLFQDRFRSEPIESNDYFLTVIRYIHQNPLKAGITKTIADYKWSSYKEYLKDSKVIDKDYALNIFAEDDPEALELFSKFNNENSKVECLEIEEYKKKLTDDDLRKVLKSKYQIEPWTIKNSSKEERRIILKKILEVEGVSTRQLARVTGVSTNIIWKL